jgi:hypothetical protein
LLLTACSSSTKEGVSSTDGDAGASEAAAPLPPCAPDQHDAGGVCDLAITWSRGPSLADGAGRDHHHTFIVDPGGTASRFLYLVGGFNGSGLLASIQRSPVADDGSLGAWQDAGMLPTPVSGAGVAISHGYVVLAGGFNATATFVSKIGADGSLGTWKSGPSLSGKRFHTTAVTHGDYIYVIGGLAGTVTTDEVVRSKIDDSGNMTPYEVVAHLPYSLSHHTTVVDGDTLYVINGQTGNTNNNSGKPHREIQIATFQADGTLSPWTRGPDTPAAYETHSSAVHDGYVFIIGGVVDATADESSGVPTEDVLRARMVSPGQLGPWAKDPSSRLPGPRSHVHQAPIFNGHIYGVSGLNETVDETDVRIGRFH